MGNVHTANGICGLYLYAHGKVLEDEKNILEIRRRLIQELCMFCGRS
jgi:hypothetical protein